jgi:hypothetical protein
MNVTILCDGLELETPSVLTRNVRKFDFLVRLKLGTIPCDGLELENVVPWRAV